jgi:acyl-CoA dehydrogenase
MATEINAAELLVLKAAWKADEGTAVDEDYAMAKLYATEMLPASPTMPPVFGGGLMPDLPIERLWRDARVGASGRHLGDQRPHLPRPAAAARS